eukprot:323144-Pleurochrysis_carterae.AAC.1
MPQSPPVDSCRALTSQMPYTLSTLLDDDDDDVEDESDDYGRFSPLQKSSEDVQDGEPVQETNAEGSLGNSAAAPSQLGESQRCRANERAGDLAPSPLHSVE